MPQDALHNNLVLNLHQQLICDVRVEDLLDGNWCSVEQALVDHREATLPDLLPNLNIIHADLADTRDRRQPSGGR